MKSRKQVLKKRFLSTLYLSAFTFGGGYVIVTQHSWLSLQEFADLVAIAEMTPGPIAINAATFVGTRLAGVPSALTATPGGRGHDRFGRLLRKTKLSPILVMLLAGAVNLPLPA